MIKTIKRLSQVSSTLSSNLSSNTNRSLSGVFKKLRKSPKISHIGDYPLLSYIIRYGHSRTPQYTWTRSQILYAIRQIGFYKLDRKTAYIPKEWEKYIKDE